MKIIVFSWGADLVIIGTHGRRGIRRLFLGSVAEGLTRAKEIFTKENTDE
jgi:nucleotide-binding universal stress UspA family protein